MNIKRIMHGRVRINGETHTEFGEASLGVLAQQAVKFIIESSLKAEEARTITIEFSTRRFTNDSAPKEISVDDLLALQENIGKPRIDEFRLDDCPATVGEFMGWLSGNESFAIAENAVRKNQIPSTINLTHQMVQYLAWLKIRLREKYDDSIS